MVHEISDMNPLIIRWKWTRRKAIELTQTHLTFHKSTRIPALRWGDVENINLVRYDQLKIGFYKYLPMPSFVIKYLDPIDKTFSEKALDNLDLKNTAGKQFIEILASRNLIHDYIPLDGKYNSNYWW